MSLEAITKIKETEEQMRRQKADAELQARQIKAGARQAGEALLAQVREEAAQQEKALLARAEQRVRDEISRRNVQADADALREEAQGRLAEAVDFIVERVVRN